MQIGMGMLLWADDVADESWTPLFSRLKSLGFDFVEVPVFDTEPARYRRLAARLRGIGLEATAVTALSAERHLIADEPARRRAGLDHLRAAADCARELGSPLLGGPLYQGLGVFSGAAPTAAERARAVEGLRAAAEHSAAAGVTLAVEYLNRFEVHLLNCAADAAAFVREIGHPRVGLTWDTFHAHIEEKDAPAALRSCADVLVHVQASENDRSTPGRGQVDWAGTAAALRAADYRGRVAIEAFGQKLPALAAATRIWRRTFESEEKLAADGLAFLRAALS
jgi:D-psicose/D-tagatose/L-ribulose 3-epimerase